jgi:hypothetical protein
VFGIIALLISMLLSARSSARTQARSTVCLSNLRQRGIACTMYINENKQTSMYWSGVIESSEPNTP